MSSVIGVGVGVLVLLDVAVALAEEVEVGLSVEVMVVRMTGVFVTVCPFDVIVCVDVMFVANTVVENDDDDEFDAVELAELALLDAWATTGWAESARRAKIARAAQLSAPRQLHANLLDEHID